MKKWEFTYRTKSGREKIINNENCWKHLEEDIWRGIAWCEDHFGVVLAVGGAGLLAIAAGKQMKKKPVEPIPPIAPPMPPAPEGDVFIITDVDTAMRIQESLAENPPITTETIK